MDGLDFQTRGLVEAFVRERLNDYDVKIRQLQGAGPRALVAAGDPLPAGVDGLEVDYQAAAGVVWGMRFNAGAGTWDWVGGSELEVLGPGAGEVGPAVSSTWGNLSTVGPDFVVPWAGTWATVADAELLDGGSNVLSQIGVAIGNGTPARTARANGLAGAGTMVECEARVVAVAGDTLRVRYWATTTTGLWYQRRLSVRPVSITG